MPKSEGAPVKSLADLEAREGFKWVRAHYKDADGVVETLADGSQAIEVKTFGEGEEVRTAWFQVSRKIQPKQYESLDVSMGVSVPCRVEEAPAALKHAEKLVEVEFKPIVDDLLRKLGRG